MLQPRVFTELRYDTGEAVQRVGPATLFQQPNVRPFLRLMNAGRFNVFVSVNAWRLAVRAIHHVSGEVAHDGRGGRLKSYPMEPDLIAG